VGVNKYSIQEETPINTLKIDFKTQRRQVNRLRKLRDERDGAKVKAHLEKLRRAYSNPDANAIYPMMDAVMAYATLGEIMQVGREIFGSWKEPMIV
jgi:methylmalonyl-CoA mutase N-terminal domain/subunit